MLSLTNLLKPQGALFKLLKYQGINIGSDIIKDELGKHPDSPSMLAICDVLRAFDIENDAFRLDFERLGDLECPFLAHTNNDKGDLVVVTKMEGDSFYVSNEHWEKHKLTAESFKKLYTGIVLVVEPSENFNAAKFRNVLKDYQLPAMILGLALILASALIFNAGYFANMGWQSLLLTFFKSAGLITAVLLLIQSVDSNNPLVQVICQSGGKTDCNAILTSEAANVFKGLTWSEAGFFYFAGTWLLLLFGGNSVLTWQALAFLNLISLPYTVYSIYYQARIAKQWCVLCCTVQALLWLEFIPLTSNFLKSGFSFSVDASGAAWSTLFICMAAPVILWVMLLKPLFLKSQEIRTLKQQLREFKYNTELFNKLLAEQPAYPLPGDEWSMTLGNVEANNVITMVSGPHCAPCSKVHKQLEELLEQNDNIQARIIFKTQNIDTDPTTPISRHLMALYALPDKAKVKQAMLDWYGQKVKNYDDWAKRHPVNFDDAQYYKLDKQRDWCNALGIHATPTLILNGNRLPELYQLQDLKYMLD